MSDSPELPVAALVNDSDVEKGGYRNVNLVVKKPLGRGEKFVKRRDVEEAIQKARRKVLPRVRGEIDKIARREERQEILNKIEQMKKEARITKLNAPDVRKALNQLRDDLQERDENQ